MDKPKIINRVRAVIIKNDHVLLAYSPERDFYFYIGGKIDFGETIKEAFSRELKEECKGEIVPIFSKILYIRELLIPEEDEHSIEYFVLGDIDKYKGVEQELITSYDSHVFIKWLPMSDLPTNLKPAALTQKLLTDWKNGFPNEGEYLGRI